MENSCSVCNHKPSYRSKFYYLICSHLQCDKCIYKSTSEFRCAKCNYLKSNFSIKHDTISQDDQMYHLQIIPNIAELASEYPMPNAKSKDQFRKYIDMIVDSCKDKEDKSSVDRSLMLGKYNQDDSNLSKYKIDFETMRNNVKQLESQQEGQMVKDAEHRRSEELTLNNNNKNLTLPVCDNPHPVVKDQMQYRLQLGYIRKSCRGQK